MSLIMGMFPLSLIPMRPEMGDGPHIGRFQSPLTVIDAVMETECIREKDHPEEMCDNFPKISRINRGRPNCHHSSVWLRMVISNPVGAG
jgi:hypothetical protein